MCWLWLLLFCYVAVLSWTYFVMYYESANGSHLEKLRGRGSLVTLFLKGFTWNIYSHLMAVACWFTNWSSSYWGGSRQKGEQLPVIFVHGLYHNRTAWFMYLRWFRQWGWSYLEAVNLPGKFRSINVHAQTLAQTIDRVLEAADCDQVDLVGHSMGGIVIRAYLRDHFSESKVRNVVTLGSPHNGSKLAVFGVGEAARELLPHSELLQSLNGEGVMAPPAGSLYSIYTVLDNMVLPNESAQVVGERVESIETKEVDHVGLLYCKQTAQLVRKCLERGE
ncbi:MAG: alpha/beta fold hydrolase [Deltaproteobacteria bacterium]|nr:alpha/beta fold hydrolase [Deltaproteobacteria bacterium]MBW2072051.1 alpha/beta fold hydrolase [Deltaproteobacteria bacterium]